MQCSTVYRGMSLSLIDIEPFFNRFVFILCITVKKKPLRMCNPHPVMGSDMQICTLL